MDPAAGRMLQAFRRRPGFIFNGRFPLFPNNEEIARWRIDRQSVKQMGACCLPSVDLSPCAPSPADEGEM